jgi:hypothetical protein
MPSIALTRPYIPPTYTTAAPAPTATPGYPAPTVYPVVQEHSASGGSCGCGDTHAAAASPASGAVAVTVPDSPRFLTSNLRTPEGFSPPPLTGEPMLEQLSALDWKKDWWKYIVGAVAYRVLFD